MAVGVGYKQTEEVQGNALVTHRSTRRGFKRGSVSGCCGTGSVVMGDRRRCRSEAGRRGGRQARTKQVRAERKNERKKCRRRVK